MRDLFFHSPWPGIIAWALIYISDFVFTMTCARLYRRSIGSKIVFEGSFELNPIFQRDVDSLRLFSPKFIAMLLATSTVLTLYWYATVATMPEFYVFVLGAMLGSELAIHIRHLTNLYLFGSRSTADQVRGRIEYARPLILRMSSVQVLGFAILFAIVFGFTGSLFVAGSATSCFFLALKHWVLARRADHARTKKAEQAAATC